jgi:electron transport complex protein RnfC
VATRDAFPAGLALDAHKQQALRTPIVELPPPARVVLSLDQGSGSVLEPVVAVGTEVRCGSVIARPVDAYGATLHAPISGRVVAIGPRESASGSGVSPSIEIEGDGRDARDESAAPVDALTLEPQALVERLREAGIAGLGGAAFPTATKLEAARSRGARTLLLNGAECEPWICCDDALMRTEAADVVLGARVLMRALEAPSCLIAVEDDKPEALEALAQALAAAPAEGVELRVVAAVYPRGAERQLTSAMTGVEVPSRGLPADVGVTCQNVATAAAVARWARRGEPCISRVVTVTGGSVAAPRNVRARLGTPLEQLVAAAGGYCGTPVRLIAGGSMTGRTLGSDAAGLTKAINCVFVAGRDDLAPRLEARELPCIRCGDCATVCPPRLLPQQIHRAVRAADDDAAVQLGVWDCIDCGCCDYVCPSQIPLAQRFREARARLREREAAAARAASAQLARRSGKERLQEAARAEQAAFDAARAQARLAARDGDAPGQERAP